MEAHRGDGETSWAWLDGVGRAYAIRPYPTRGLWQNTAGGLATQGSRMAMSPVDSRFYAHSPL